VGGDLGVPGAAADNAYHVVSPWGTVTLDGFEIRDGSADGPRPSGGGVYCAFGGNNHFAELVLANCTLRSNRAGSAARSWQQGWHAADAALSSSSTNRGIRAALCRRARRRRKPTTARFAGNHAPALAAGALRVGSESPGDVVFTNCLFHHNSAPRGGRRVPRRGVRVVRERHVRTVQR
jgi:hypothetical protein